MPADLDALLRDAAARPAAGVDVAALRRTSRSRRRARRGLSAALVLALLAVGVAVLPDVLDTPVYFGEAAVGDVEAPWPLRMRYEIERAYAPEQTDRQLREFEGTGWDDWLDVVVSGPQPGTVRRYDTDHGHRVGRVMRPDEDRYATLVAARDAVVVDDHTIRSTVERPPGYPDDLFRMAAFARERDDFYGPGAERVAVPDEVAATATRLGLPADALDGVRHTSDCPPDAVTCAQQSLTVVTLREGAIPLYVREANAGAQMMAYTAEARVTHLQTRAGDVPRHAWPAVLPLPPRGETAAERLPGGTPVFVVHDRDGGVHVVDARTPQGSGLAYAVGWCPPARAFVGIADGEIFAPDGRWVGGPAATGLATWRAAVVDGRVHIGVRIAPAPRDTTAARPGPTSPCWGRETADTTVVRVHDDPPESEVLTPGELVARPREGFVLVHGTLVVRGDAAWLCARTEGGARPRCAGPTLRVWRPPAGGSTWVSEVLARVRLEAADSSGVTTLGGAELDDLVVVRVERTVGVYETDSPPRSDEAAGLRPGLDGQTLTVE